MRWYELFELEQNNVPVKRWWWLVEFCQKISPIDENFTDTDIEDFLSRNSKFYLQNASKIDRNVYQLDIRTSYYAGKAQMMWKIRPFMLRAGKKPSDNFSKNAPMDNRALYYFTSEQRAKDFLLQLRLILVQRDYAVHELPE